MGAPEPSRNQVRQPALARYPATIGLLPPSRHSLSLLPFLGDTSRTRRAWVKAPGPDIGRRIKRVCRRRKQLPRPPLSRGFDRISGLISPRDTFPTDVASHRSRSALRCTVAVAIRPDETRRGSLCKCIVCLLGLLISCYYVAACEWIIQSHFLTPCLTI